jgi:hypothetical protein
MPTSLLVHAVYSVCQNLDETGCCKEAKEWLMTVAKETGVVDYMTMIFKCAADLVSYDAKTRTSAYKMQHETLLTVATSWKLFYMMVRQTDETEFWIQEWVRRGVLPWFEKYLQVFAYLPRQTNMKRILYMIARAFVTCGKNNVIGVLFDRRWSQMLGEITLNESSELGGDIAQAFIDLHCVEPLQIQYDTNRQAWLWRIDCSDGRETRVWTGNASEVESAVYIPKLCEVFTTIYETSYTDDIICASVDMVLHWITSSQPRDKMLDWLAHGCGLKETLSDYIDNAESMDSEWSQEPLKKTRALYACFGSMDREDNREDDREYNQNDHPVGADEDFMLMQ